MSSENRLFYIDHLRVFTIALVVVHHFSIIYGGPGDWMYVEGKPDSILAELPLILFCSTNQSFFMGLLFFVSAFFVTPSFDRKGSRIFLKDRLIRLGIPTLVCFFLFNPFTSYLSYTFLTTDSEKHSFIHFLKMGWGRSFGAMWFVEVLIYFSLFYALFRLLRKKKLIKYQKPEPMPAAWQVLFFSVIVGILTFVLRIWTPVGWWLPYLNFQLAHFPQYIAMLIVGVVAYQRGWLESLTLKQGVAWFLFANVFIFLAFPAVFVLGGAQSGNLDPFMGGLFWQNLSYSIYEQVLGISLMIALLGIFKGIFIFNRQGKLGKALSNSSYTVYIIHSFPLLLVGLSLRHWEFPLLPKFIILSLPALILCFAMAWLIRKIPGFSKAL